MNKHFWGHNLKQPSEIDKEFYLDHLENIFLLLIVLEESNASPQNNHHKEILDADITQKCKHSYYYILLHNEIFQSSV